MQYQTSVLNVAIIKNIEAKVAMSKAKESIIFLLLKAVLLKWVGFKILVKNTYKARNKGNKSL